MERNFVTNSEDKLQSPHNLVPQKLRWMSSLFLLPVAVLLGTAPADAARLQVWRFDTNQNRLEFTTDEGVQPRAQLVSDPTRLVIDLPGVTWGRPALTQPYTGAVRSVRVGQFDRGITRIVVELAPGYTIDPNQVKFRGITAQQWSVQIPTPQLTSAQNPNDVVVPTESPEPLFRNPRQPSLPSSSPPSPRPLFRKPPQPLPVPAPPIGKAPDPSPSPIPRGKTVVVIDPGHGGPDPGAVGIGGLQEKTIVMDISQQVAAILEQKGIQAVLSRSADVDLDLQPRVALAEQVRANLFVSIHANSINLSRQDISGLETYYYNSGYDLARTIHQSVLDGTGIQDRRVRQARFYVLQKTSMPSVLVEVGFVTGRDDAKKLSTPAYRRRMAESIAQGLLRYLGKQATR